MHRLHRVVREASVALGRFLQLGLDDQAGDEGGQALLQRLLDEARHEKVALHLDVLAQIQARDRGANAQLSGLHRFVGQIPLQRPLLLDIQPHGRVDVCL